MTAEEIKNTVDNIIKKAREEKNHPMQKEPIDWGDLRLDTIERIQATYGGYFYRIIIRGGPPGECPHFCQYLSENFPDLGFPVEFVTEW